MDTITECQGFVGVFEIMKYVIGQRVMIQLPQESFHGIVNEISGCERWLRIIKPPTDAKQQYEAPFNEWFSLHARNVTIKAV